MLQLIPHETPEVTDYYDKCLNAIRCILMDYQDEAVNFRAIIRMGEYVLLHIDNYYHTFCGVDTTNERLKETVKILRAKLQYLLGFLIESSEPELRFSLYSTTPTLETYYLQYSYLIMKIGPFDLITYNHFESQISK
ncbi:hypothetical protein [Acetivibrio mesophilus]|uniref:Uncharacterized protein n=1 Tax=Acetivibrio mesophilus TaxID=2487273 RepID=A0A4Q0I0K1_9FIRM|nr:hypothetical protein [Acetivibrio mesophilus]RXE57736.1 hypothetical protein EFD62_16105 [Acetivibrio mesophilus]